jgi:hypothetical protein
VSARMPSIERLARRICWVEFNGMSAKKLGTTEVKYWREIHADAKAEYLEEARRMCWAVNAIHRSPGGLNIWWEARKSAQTEAAA